VQKYLQTITLAIQHELFIGGLSIGDENTRSMALINGVPFRRGDRIPLPIEKEQLLQLHELARMYGLPLEKGVDGLTAFLWKSVKSSRAACLFCCLVSRQQYVSCLTKEIRRRR